MTKGRRLRVVIDTNIWISFLIGKKLSALKTLISSQKIEIIISDEIIDEIEEVSARPKLNKYFPAEKVQEFINLLNILSTRHSIRCIEAVCRDPKDDFLLALVKETKADYLITGDNDLLLIEKHGATQIVTAEYFDGVFKFGN